MGAGVTIGPGARVKEAIILDRAEVRVRECLTLNMLVLTPLYDYNFSLLYDYHIALNFRESKFSRIEIFEDFIEIISQTHCTRTPHAACQKFSLKY